MDDHTDQIAAEDAPMSPPKVTGSPAEIWLVYGDIDDDETHAACERAGVVYWCEDKQFDSDVRYVRADLAAPQPAAERVATAARDALRAARECILIDRLALSECHFDQGLGRVDDDGQAGLDQYDEVLAKIDAALASQSAGSVPLTDAEGWVPMGAHRPKLDVYLVANSKGQVAPLIRGVIHNTPGTANDWQYGEAITHWRPLPSATSVLEAIGHQAGRGGDTSAEGGL